MNNRRRHTRVPTHLDYDFFLDNQEYIGKVENISLSGAFLSNPEPEMLPSHISQTGELKIRLNDELLRLKCETVYVVGRDSEFFPVGTGVCFDETDEGTQASVSKLAAAFDL